MLRRWWLADARWWQFWMPQSSLPGGIIGGAIVLAVCLVALGVF
jgi:hypothetical protein